MASARLIMCMPPVEAMRGKFAQSKDKVTKMNPGFQMFVGLQKSYSTTNRFALRKKALPDQTQAQKEQVDKFKRTITAVAALTAEQIAAYRVEFAKQTKYLTLRGFMFAKEYAKLT